MTAAETADVRKLESLLVEALDRLMATETAKYTLLLVLIPACIVTLLPDSLFCLVCVRVERTLRAKPRSNANSPISAPSSLRSN